MKINRCAEHCNHINWPTLLKNEAQIQTSLETEEATEGGMYFDYRKARDNPQINFKIQVHQKSAP